LSSPATQRSSLSHVTVKPVPLPTRRNLLFHPLPSRDAVCLGCETKHTEATEPPTPHHRVHCSGMCFWGFVSQRMYGVVGELRSIPVYSSSPQTSLISLVFGIIWVICYLLSFRGYPPVIFRSASKHSIVALCVMSTASIGPILFLAFVWNIHLLFPLCTPFCSPPASFPSLVSSQQRSATILPLRARRLRVAIHHPCHLLQECAHLKRELIRPALHFLQRLDLAL